MHPGLSGWTYKDTEVLELLAFWKPEQQTAHRFHIWRPIYDLLKMPKFPVDLSFWVLYNRVLGV